MTRHTPPIGHSVELRIEGSFPEHVARVLAAVDSVLDLPNPLPQSRPGRKGGHLLYVKVGGVKESTVLATGRSSNDAGCITPANPEPAASSPRKPPLIGQPWYPLRPGDVVLHHPGSKRVGARTYLAVDSPKHVELDGCARLRLISGNPPPPQLAKANNEPAPVDLDAMFGDGLVSFTSLWATSSATDMTVIRAGRILFG